jgi:hypothetical protein
MMYPEKRDGHGWCVFHQEDLKVDRVRMLAHCFATKRDAIVWMSHFEAWMAASTELPSWLIRTLSCSWHYWMIGASKQNDHL